MNGTDKGKIHSVLEWRKSSHSGPYGECVELAIDGKVLLVRDSKNPDGPTLRLGHAGRRALAAALRGLLEG